MHTTRGPGVGTREAALLRTPRRRCALKADPHTFSTVRETLRFTARIGNCSVLPHSTSQGIHDYGPPGLDGPGGGGVSQPPSFAARQHAAHPPPRARGRGHTESALQGTHARGGEGGLKPVALVAMLAGGRGKLPPRPSGEFQEPRAQKPGCGNDPPAGSPTGTLLRLLLPLAEEHRLVSAPDRPDPRGVDRGGVRQPPRFSILAPSVATTGGVYK